MLSIVILAKNEEKVIGRTIKSAQWTDEVIVIDDNSIDATAHVAKKTGARVFLRRLEGDFAEQRNFGIEKAKGDWVLFIDADEVVSPQLAIEIRKVISGQENRTQAYYIKRRDFFWGQEMKWGELQTLYKNGLIRLMKKGSGQWQGTIHESFITSQPVGKLKSFINHHPHATISNFLKRINYYSTLRAVELAKAGQKSNVLEIIFLPLGKFIYTYFVKQGFRDKEAGFAYSFMMSFHSFLVRAKLYLKTH